MILKVETRIKKMGANLSKKKKKHHESLLTQTRTVIGDESPPQSPRSLSSTLSSSALTAEFKAFLARLDSADPDLEGSGRVTSLQFVQDIRALCKASDELRGEMVEEIGDLYFKVPGEGLVLENNQLWVRCSEVCRSSVQPVDLVYLEKARDSVLGEMDDLHLIFMAQRDSNPLKEIVNCIL